MGFNRGLVHWAGMLNAIIAGITLILGVMAVVAVLTQPMAGLTVLLLVGAALAAHGIIAALVQIEDNTRRGAEACEAAAKALEAIQGSSFQAEDHARRGAEAGETVAAYFRRAAERQAGGA